MRRFMLRAIPLSVALFACGCFWMQETRKSEPAPLTPTQTYWQQANAILMRQPSGTDMRSLVNLVRTQTDALRDLPTDDVDADLVAAVDEVVACEEEVLRRAEMANYDPVVLKTSRAMAVVFADANRKASEAKKRLRALQPVLKSRYGSDF